jgi:hypothetical protein
VPVAILDPEDIASKYLDEHSMMTYISFFRDWEANNEAEGNILIFLTTFSNCVEDDGSETDASKCSAFGTGLQPGNTEGEPAEFTVQTRNKNGDLQTEGGDKIDVREYFPFAAICDNFSGKSSWPIW